MCVHYVMSVRRYFGQKYGQRGQDVVGPSTLRRFHFKVRGMGRIANFKLHFFPYTKYTFHICWISLEDSIIKSIFGHFLWTL